MIEEKNVKNFNNKKNIVIVLIIVVLIILIAFFISSNIDSNKQVTNSNSSKKPDILNNDSEEKNESNYSGDINNQNNSRTEYVDESYVCPEGLELLVDFIGYRGVFGNNNMLDNKNIRIQYIQFLLMKENNVTWTSGQYQSFPYVQEADFKNKYYDIFDSSVYKYENDQDSDSFIDCNIYEETKNKNYKCWNGTWGTYGNKLYLYVKEKSDTVISGEYKRSSNESGIFEIKYNVKNNKRYLKSIIMNNNK